MSNLNKEDGMWRPSDMYSQVGSNNSSASSFTNATLGSSSSNDGVQLSLRSSSFSLRAHTPIFSHASSRGAQGVNVGSSSSFQKGGASAGALYTTSSAEVRSFGGGGNVSAGTAGGFRASAQGSIAQAAGVSSSLSVGGASYTPVLSTSSSVSNDEMLAMAQASNVASASGYAGLGYTTATYGTASYGSSSPRGVSSRKKMPGFNDSWWMWFDTWVSQNGSGYGVSGEDGSYIFDRYTLYEVYSSFISDYWNSGMGDAPSFEEWLDWYQQAISDGGGSYGYNKHTYYWQPVGDIWPLFVMMLLYAAYVMLRKRKAATAQND